MSRRERKAYKDLKAQEAAQAKLDAEKAKLDAEKAKKEASRQAREKAKADWEAKSPEEKKKAFITFGGVAAVIVVVIALFSAFGGGDSDDAEPAQARDSANQAEPNDAVASKPKSQKKSSSSSPAADLGKSVEKALLAANGVKRFTQLSTSSPGFAITSIDALNSSTVRVNVQMPLSKDEKKSTGGWILRMSCLDVNALSTVVVRDTSGVDTNVYKMNTPVPNGCG